MAGIRMRIEMMHIARVTIRDVRQVSKMILIRRGGFNDSLFFYLGGGGLCSERQGEEFQRRSFGEGRREAELVTFVAQHM